jgi:hypothetical protein
MSSNCRPTGEAEPPLGSLAEYEARRCAICGAKYPSFGFVPPMTRPGLTIWACFAHWKDVESQLTTWRQAGRSPDLQGTLL